MCAVLGGCGGGGDPGGSRQVSGADFPGDWPLTVESGTLRCEGSGGVGAVTFEAGGRVYAVNGTAKSKAGNLDIASIWADDPQSAGLKEDMGAFTDAGLALCR